MTKIFVVIFAVFSFFVVGGATAALAHQEDGALDQPQALMEQMMGKDWLGTMEQIEDRLMSESVHRDMERLMEKMLDGSLTEEEQHQMVRLMQSNNDIGYGASFMMMRLMVPEMMQRSGALSPREFSAPMMSGSGWWPGSVWTFWVTSVLLWSALVLGIVRLLRVLTIRKS
ncbi:hypothetical protein HY628_02335 [Candidatus Uhrbacteria bacterium]|nr:hypothetical protein [Candidatus Uhrbacteria bacterium]